MNPRTLSSLLNYIERLESDNEGLRRTLEMGGGPSRKIFEAKAFVTKARAILDVLYRQRGEALDLTQDAADTALELSHISLILADAQELLGASQ